MSNTLLLFTFLFPDAYDLELPFTEKLTDVLFDDPAFPLDNCIRSDAKPLKLVVCRFYSSLF